MGMLKNDRLSGGLSPWVKTSLVSEHMETSEATHRKASSYSLHPRKGPIAIPLSVKKYVFQRRVLNLEIFPRVSERLS